MAKKLIIFLLALLPVTCWGNALNLGNFVVDQAAGTVTFTVSWQNSWRVNVVPFNWDAVWLFVKFRECGVDPNTEWTHGVLDLGGSTIPAALEATQKDGTAGMDADNLGLMIRQAVADVYPTTGPHTITLSVTNLPAAGTLIDVKTFGIEMVFIPSGAYNLGDGTSSFAYSVQNIPDESAIVLVGGNGVSLPAAYPKGTEAMYVMKYEISQGQYAEFLNTIPSIGGMNRFTSNYNNYRNSIHNGGAAPDIYVADYEDRACNFLMWTDLSAYLDWSALRPMSELEYEKICRGSDPPLAQEYAWGSTNIFQAQNISTTIPTEDGTEIFLPSGTDNCVYSNYAFGGSPGGGNRGPVRVGIFALPTTSTREAAGATYFGVMEMSGNVLETIVPASDNASTFTPVLGDGYLTGTGEHDVATWPVPTAEITGSGFEGPNNNRYVGHRGGGWDNGWGEIRMNSRYYCYYTRCNDGSHTNEYYSVGGRGVR